MRVAVTGSSGFIGGHLCRYLAQQGHDVVAISRQQTGEDIAQEVVVDITDANEKETFRSAILNCDAVVHTVGVTHLDAENAFDSYEKFRRINVGAAVTVAKECVAANVKTLIFISSVKAVAEISEIDINGKTRRVFDSDDPQPRDNYGRTKLEAENSIAEILQNTETGFVILRPPLVYGVGQKGNLAKLFKLLSKRVPVLFPKINNKRSMISVDNLCDAICAVIKHRDTKSGRYLISDIELSSSQLVVAIAKVLMSRVVYFPLSPRLIKLLAKLIGKEQQAEKLTSSLIVDDANFRKEFNWQPPFEFKEIVSNVANSHSIKK